MHHLEWYADTIHELREWEHLLRELMVSADASGGGGGDMQRAHWFLMLIAGEEGSHKRWVRVDPVSYTHLRAHET